MRNPIITLTRTKKSFVIFYSSFLQPLLEHKNPDNNISCREHFLFLKHQHELIFPEVLSAHGEHTISQKFKRLRPAGLFTTR